MPSQIHWYELKRSSPSFAPGDKDDWAIPEAHSFDEALSYFEKELNCRLMQCEEDEAGDFVLQKWTRHVDELPEKQSVNRGELVADFWIQRVR